MEGLVEKIDVRYLRDENAHEILIHFRLPIVDDGIAWKDEKKKSKGYQLVSGKKKPAADFRKMFKCF